MVEVIIAFMFGAISMFNIMVLAFIKIKNDQQKYKLTQGKLSKVKANLRKKLSTIKKTF